MKKTKKFYVKPKERQRNVLLRSGKKKQRSYKRLRRRLTNHKRRLVEVIVSFIVKTIHMFSRIFIVFYSKERKITIFEVTFT